MNNLNHMETHMNNLNHMETHMNNLNHMETHMNNLNHPLHVAMYVCVVVMQDSGNIQIE